jgi:hypothetical protein
MAGVLRLRKEASINEALGRLKGALVRVWKNNELPAEARKLPPILINTMPKSASIYLTKTVSKLGSGVLVGVARPRPFPDLFRDACRP